jgi:lipopolysaccharide assembly outer membrane protein LptD (OstA)
MRKRLCALWLAAALGSLLLLPTALAAEPVPLPADLTAEGEQLEYQRNENLLIYRRGVVIRYQGVTIRADEVRLNTLSLDVEAIGNVTFERDNSLVIGSRLVGNLKTRAFEYETFDGHFNKWTFSAQSASRSADGTYTASRAALTTCDDWWLRARRLVHQPNGDFSARHVTFHLFGVPLFYLPYLSGNTNRESAQWTLRAGHRSAWGFYLMLGREWRLGDQGDTLLWADVRTSRGVGVGNEGRLNSDRNTTDWHAYYLNDHNPPTDRTINDEDYSQRFRVEEDRYRLQLFERYHLTPALTFTGNVDHYSDNDLMMEFYEDVYQTYREPPTFAQLAYSHERFDASLYLRARANDFFSTVEKLPELRLDLPRQTTPIPGLYYQGQNSATLFRTNWREYDLPRVGAPTELDDYATWRFDTVHFAYYPIDLDPVTLVPRAGARFTHYERSSATSVSDANWDTNFLVDDDRSAVRDTLAGINYTDDGGHQGRSAYELGLEANTKFTRTWQDVEGTWLDLDGLRHVVEPYANYTFIGTPSDSRDELYYFDEVDRLDEVNAVRVGTKQRFQTRRNQRIHTFARIENFYDFYLTPEADQPHEGELGTALEFSPTERFTYSLAALVASSAWQLNTLDIGTTYHATRAWWTRISYLYRDEYRQRYHYSMGSDLTQVGPTQTTPLLFSSNHNLQLTLHWDVNAKTALETRHYLDLEEGTLAMQSYEISRDWRCWITALRLEENGDNFRVMLLLTLKGIGRVKAGG